MGTSGIAELKQMPRDEAERRILRRGWLADQPGAIQAEILHVARLVYQPTGNVLFHAGDVEGGICGLVSGGVGIHLPVESGEAVLVHIGRSGTWFGYGPFVRGQRRTLSFSLIEPSWLLHLPLAGLQSIANRSPAHQRGLLSLSEYGMDVAMRVIDTLLIRNADRRIAATILRALRSSDEEEYCTPPDLRLTQSQLGEMANADRQVVNRALKRMEIKGWLKVSYGGIDVTNLRGLQAYVRSG
jgi:CRP/FNR family transcriptional regulator, cyclic AMP receptor protein